MIPLFGYSTPEPKLIFGAFISFVAANALEGLILSLFSKVISKKLAEGVFNAGFLATEAGTLGRSCGNALITLLGIYVSCITS